MDLAFRVGRVFGITIRMHVVFVLMFGLLLARTIWSRGVDVALESATRFAILFTCVVLHELGHSLAAQAKGIRVYDIVLWPLGGMARLARIPEDPSTELKIAVAGPAVNFFLVLILFPMMLARGEGTSLEPLALLAGSPLEFAVAVNLGMGLFNLVPAFPLDGGRILRALLARRVPHDAATRLAVMIGRVLAVALAAASIFAGAMPIVLLLVAFVWWVGGQELRHLDAKQRPVPRREPTPGARRFLDLPPSEPETARPRDGGEAFGRLLEEREGRPK